MATNDEIIGYVLNTPNNTNPNVLRDMLNEQGGSGGGADFFVVNFTDGSDQSKKESDKSAEEIIEAIEAGAAPIGHFMLRADDMLLVSEWCLISYYTGSLSVTFNGQQYNTREGNVWDKLTS